MDGAKRPQIVWRVRASTRYMNQNKILGNEMIIPVVQENNAHKNGDTGRYLTCSKSSQNSDIQKSDLLGAECITSYGCSNPYSV